MKPNTTLHLLGVHEWNHMPFGLKTFQMSFQMGMSQVLRNMNWQYVLVHVDDIFIFSSNFTEHLCHLGQVFNRPRTVKLTLKPSILSKKCVAVHPEKTKAVNTFPVPKNLGLLQYNASFVLSDNYQAA